MSVQLVACISALVAAAALPSTAQLGEEAVLFLSRRLSSTTEGDEQVQCTYGESMCSGNECCPGAAETGGKKYPCPSADDSWNACGSSAPQAAPPSGAEQAGVDLVNCTYSDTTCAGNACCPPAAETGNKTYPCPSADAYWNECEGAQNLDAVLTNTSTSNEKVTNLASSIGITCMEAGALDEDCCALPSKGSCAEGYDFKAGSLCHQNGAVKTVCVAQGSCDTADSAKRECGFVGISAEGCADRGCCWHESMTSSVPWCFSAHKLEVGPRHMKCTYSETMCAGNTCCPGATETGGKTYTCPSAEEGWNVCENLDSAPPSGATEAPRDLEPSTPRPEHGRGHVQGSSLLVVNECTEPLWIASMFREEDRHLYPANVRVGPGETFTYSMPGGRTVASTRFWPKMGCRPDGTNCRLGSSGGPGQDCPSSGCAPPVDTKFEATFNDFNTAQPVDWFDTSGVDGYTLPYSLTLDSNCPWGKDMDCSSLSIADCPKDEVLSGQAYNLTVNFAGSQEPVGCFSHCGKLTYTNWGNQPALTPWDPQAQMYCCPTPPVSPEDCRAGPVESTKYVRLFRQKCQGVYSYAYDDAVGLQTCPTGTQYTWKLYCPS